MMSDQSHQSEPRILSRRTLQADHRRLAAVLRPGMSVLDAGCGTGAITADIARMVGPEGHVLGIDRDESLLVQARQEHHAIPNPRSPGATNDNGGRDDPMILRLRDTEFPDRQE